MTPAIAIARGLVVAAILAAPTACTEEDEPGVYTGYVEAELVYIASPQSGWLDAVPVREGSPVVAGDVLFALDQALQLAEVDEATSRLAQADAQARDLDSGARPAEIAALEAQRDEAAAALRLAVAERERWATLYARGFASQANGDAAIAAQQEAAARVEMLDRDIETARLAGRDAQREAADAARAITEAALAQAEWRLDQRTIHAPADGRIELVFHREGEFVAAGAPVLALLPPAAIKIRFFVPQAALSRIALGDTVMVSVDSRPQSIAAEISFIAREAEFTPPVIYSVDSREKLVFLVEARVADTSGLNPGQPVDVRLP